MLGNHFTWQRASCSINKFLDFYFHMNLYESVFYRIMLIMEENLPFSIHMIFFTFIHPVPQFRQNQNWYQNEQDVFILNTPELLTFYYFLVINFVVNIVIISLWIGFSSWVNYFFVLLFFIVQKIFKLFL